MVFSLAFSLVFIGPWSFIHSNYIILFTHPHSPSTTNPITTSQDLTRALAEARKAADQTRVPTLNELLPKMQAFLLKHRLDGRLFLPRIFLFLNAFLYLFPFLLPSGWGLASYRRALYTIALIHLYSIYYTHGMPKFKIEYLAQVMQDTHAPPLFLSLLLLSFKGKAYIFGLTPLLLTEGIQLLWLFTEVLTLAKPIFGKSLSARNTSLASLYTQNPQYGAISSGPARWQAIFTATISHAITLEIAMGLFLVLELFTPWRNTFGLFLFWQYLQMRYMLDKSGEVKNKFKKLDEFFLNLTSHSKCPGVVGQAYSMLRGYMGRAVAMPDPQQQQQQQRGGGGLGRCSVM